MGVKLDFALRGFLAEFVDANGYILESYFARKGGKRRSSPKRQTYPPEKEASRLSAFTLRRWETIWNIKRKCKLNGTLTKLMLFWIAEQTPLLVEVLLGKCIEFWEYCWYGSRSFCAKRWINSKPFWVKCKIHLRWFLIERGVATMPESWGNNGSVKGSVDLERRDAARKAREQYSDIVHLQASASTSTSPASQTREDDEGEMDRPSSLITVSSGRSAKIASVSLM
jgi:hypothetical protein